MQYVLTPEEYNKLDRDKATRILVELMMTLRPVLNMSFADFSDERRRHLLQEYAGVKCLKVAEKYGADTDCIDKIWTEIESEVSK